MLNTSIGLFAEAFTNYEIGIWCFDWAKKHSDHWVCTVST